MSAATAIQRKRGREYGFSDGEDLQATERDLSHFDQEAKVSRCRNRRFKAKNIRNNMLLYKSKKELKVDQISRKISLILLDRECKTRSKIERKRD